MGIYYVDTSVLLDRDGMHRVCYGDGNTYVIAGPVLGELFSQILRCLRSSSDLFNIYSSVNVKLRDDCRFDGISHIRDVIDCIISNPSVKLRLEFDRAFVSEYLNHLRNILDHDSRIEVSDAMILSMALADASADGFITAERKIVNSEGIRQYLDELRRYGRKFRIESV